MNVAELIELLRQFPPDLPVVMSGDDESGYDEVGKPDITTFYERGLPFQAVCLNLG